MPRPPRRPDQPTSATSASGVALHTDRLLIRPPRASDAEAVHAYRHHPTVRRYLPEPSTPTLDELRATLIARSAPFALGNDALLIIADPADTTVIGELLVTYAWQGRSCEIGYVLAPDHWRHGYAREAVGALVDRLFDDPKLTRLWAQLHPDNLASARVLEQAGFEFEGHARLSFWVGDDNQDDWYYGLTRATWETWRDRPQRPPTEMRLVEIDESNQHAVRRLAVHRSQERLVAPVVASMADALFPEHIDGAPVLPWYRAVEADGELVGFVMLALVTDAHPEPYLWRLLVDRRHQGRGIGRRILDLVVDELATSGATSLLTSWVEGTGSPAPFYARYGFERTGTVLEGEIEGRLAFADTPRPG